MAKKLIIITLLVLIISVTWGIVWRLLLRNQKVQGLVTDLSPSEIIALTNLERVKAGKKPLTPSSLLDSAAQSKAQDMISLSYFSHTNPEGKGSWDLIEQTGYHYQHAGENLGRNFSSSIDLVAAWMKSPSHKDNLLSESYTEIGVAVVESGQETYVVQILASAYNPANNTIPAGTNFSTSSPLIAQRFLISSHTNLALISLAISGVCIYIFYHFYFALVNMFVQKKPDLELWKKL